MGFNPASGKFDIVPPNISIPTIATVVLATKNVPYSQVITAKYFRFRSRLDSLLKIQSSSGGAYKTLYPGEEYESPNFTLDTSITIWLTSNKDNDIIELEKWS